MLKTRSAWLLGAGKVSENIAEVLRDTACNDVTVRREVIHQKDFADRMVYVIYDLQTKHQLPC